MRKSRFTESQIIGILKEVESGRTGQEVCREHGISEQTLYRWKKKYGGMEASDAKRLRELEEENRKLNGRPVVSRGLRPMYRNRAASRRAVDEILTLDFDRIVPAHHNIIESNGVDVFRGAYTWLKS